MTMLKIKPIVSDIVEEIRVECTTPGQGALTIEGAGPIGKCNFTTVNGDGWELKPVLNKPEKFDIFIVAVPKNAMTKKEFNELQNC